MIGFLASVKMSVGNPCHPQSDFDVVKERIVISGWQKSKKSVLSVGDKQIFTCYPCVPCEVKVISNSR